jgi:hypothetical protein
MPDITLPPRKSRVYLPTVIFDVSATVAIPPIVLRNSIVFVQLSWVIDLSGYALRAFCGVLDVLLPRICYAAQVTGTNGGGRQRNLTRRRRF